MKSGARTDLASIDARFQLSDAQAAKLMKVSEPSVERAKRRMRTDPEAHAKAKAGTLAEAQAALVQASEDAARVGRNAEGQARMG